MRIRFIAMGSHGDVRPYVALGAGLHRAGHDVRIITHPAYEQLVRRHGMEFAPLAEDPRDRANSPELRALHEDGHNIFHWLRSFKEVAAPLMRQRLRDCWEGCADAQLIMVGLVPYLFGYAVARKLGVPLVRAFYFPVTPTRSYPADFVPAILSHNERLNLASYQVQRQLLWQIARPWMNRACRDVLGPDSLPLLEPFGELDRRQQLLLYGYSPAVAPPPPDWGPWVQVTGYWFLDEALEWTPPPALAAFLEAGPPPVCIGFSSMSTRELLEIVSRALALTGQRAVVLTEWGGLAPVNPPPGMFVIDRVPHDWLFPRVAAVVHHGGAGTTARGLLAGVPTIIVPFFFDQFIWAKRVSALGAGPQAIPRKALNADNLAAALRLATTDPGIRDRAAAVGKRIRVEEGVANAVAAFERHICTSSPGMFARAGK
uniref:Glycosyl transferase, family 28 n=1 Tax=Solibacter usitatus (strain Ellin6076) TaxID=234267 RepID=Q026U4_SOLUE